MIYRFEMKHKKGDLSMLKGLKRVLVVSACSVMLLSSVLPVGAASPRRTCDGCGIGQLYLFTEERDVVDLGEASCEHGHKYGTDLVVAGFIRSGYACQYCGMSYYNGGWQEFTRRECHGYD